MYDAFLDAPQNILSPESYNRIFKGCCPPYAINETVPRIVHCICAALHGGPQQQLQYLARASHDRALAHICIDEHLYPYMEPDTSGDLRQSGLLLCRRNDAHMRYFWQTMTSRHLALAGYLPPSRVVRQLIASMAGLLSILRPHILLSWHPVGIPPMDTALWAALLAGVPKILIRFNSTAPVTGPDAHNMPEWLTPQMRFLVRSPRVSLLANSHAGSASVAAWLGLAEDDIPVIPNGFNTQRCQPSVAEQSAFRQKWGIPAEATLLAGVFRLNAGKKPETFVDVLKQAFQQVPDLYCIHAGDGPCGKAFRHMLAAAGVTERVTLLGATGEKDVDSLLASADVLLSTSLQEGLSNVWLEAMFHKTVPVVTDVGDAALIIEHGTRGFVHAPHDVTGMVRSVVTLLNDTPLRRRMADAGHVYILCHFALDHYANEMQHKILNILAE